MDVKVGQVWKNKSCPLFHTNPNQLVMIHKLEFDKHTSKYFVTITWFEGEVLEILDLTIEELYKSFELEKK